jgi:hypothetical protein
MKTNTTPALGLPSWVLELALPSWVPELALPSWVPELALPPWVPELTLPSWMPEPIAEYVRAKHVGDINRVYREVLKEDGYLDDVPDDCIDWVSREFIDDDVVVRAKLTEAHVQDELADRTGGYLSLACDPRMKSVWRELSKQRRNGGFLHPAADKDELTTQHGGRRLKTAPSSKVNPKARQDAAMLELFKAALECRSRYSETTTQRQAEQKRNQLLAKADMLKIDAALMWSCGGEKLEAAAQVYRDRASVIYAASLATALKRKHDGRGRWVAITISSKFCELFGSPMHGLTAAITSVILGRKVTPRTARHRAEYPAYKLPKIAL